MKTNQNQQIPEQLKAFIDELIPQSDIERQMLANAASGNYSMGLGAGYEVITLKRSLAASYLFQALQLLGEDVKLTDRPQIPEDQRLALADLYESWLAFKEQEDKELYAKRGV